MKGQRSPCPLVLIYNQCLNRFNIFRKCYDFRLNIYIENWTFQDFSNINVLRIKFSLAVRKIKVNPDSSFVQTW